MKVTDSIIVFKSKVVRRQLSNKTKSGFVKLTKPTNGENKNLEYKETAHFMLDLQLEGYFGEQDHQSSS